MRPRFIAAAAAAVAFLAFAAAIPRVPSPGPLGDEATEALSIASLWRDHDLRFEPADLERSYTLYQSGPRGLRLRSGDGGGTRTLATALPYVLAAVPAYAVLGDRGVVGFNACLFLLVAGVAWKLRGTAGDSGGLYAIGFVVGSAMLGYAWRLGPHAFEFAAVFGGLALWWEDRRQPTASLARSALAGGLLALGAAQQPLAVWIAVAVLCDLVLTHRRRRSALFAAAFVAVMIPFWYVQLREARSGEVRAFPEPAALDRGAEGWSEGETIAGLRGLHGLTESPGAAWRGVGYLLAGRHSGLLPFYPFVAVALVMFIAGPRDRPRWLLFAALAGATLCIAVERAELWGGPLSDLGDGRWAALAPAAFFLPGGLVRRRWLVLAAIATGLWILPAAFPRWERDGRPGWRAPAHAVLPVELTLLAAHRLDDYSLRVVGDVVWALPRREAFAEEGGKHGVWLLGASRAEVFLCSPRPLDHVSFKLFSFAPDNVARAGAGRSAVFARFDSEAKRADGVPISLAVSPIAADLGGFFPPPQHEYYYRLTLDSSAGGVPRRVWRKNPDARYLGTFVSFDGEAP